MAHPGETVADAISENIGNYEPPTAKSLADMIAYYAVIAEHLRRAIVGLSQHIEVDHPGIHHQTREDLNEMARTALQLSDQAGDARDHFWDNHKFWMDDGSE